MKKVDRQSKSTLEQEVLLLGGTKEDVALLNGVDSDEGDEYQEFDDRNGATVTSEDLKKFMNSIGLAADKGLAAEFFAAEVDEESDDDGDEDDNGRSVGEKSAKSNDKPQTIHSESTSINPKHSTSGALLFQPTPLWYNIDLGDINSVLNDRKQNSTAKTNLKKKSPEAIRMLYQYAKSLAEKESKGYENFKSRSSASDVHWFKTLLKSGTLTDRVSALALAIQESPIHTVSLLETLISMAKKKNRREAVASIDALKDLILGNGDDTGLVPGDRKLLFFGEQPQIDQLVNHFKMSAVASELVDLNAVDTRQIFGNLDLKKRLAIEKHLILSYVEDAVKTRYYELILLFDQFSHDPVYHIKSKMVVHAYDLLCAKKEQERTLLTFIVNKLGDNDRKLASKITYLLHQLITKYPLMKLVIVKEVEIFIWRKGVTDRARYYGLVFLNQIALSKSDSDVLTARYLVKLYFAVFEKLLNTAGDDADNEHNNSETLKGTSKKSAKSTKTEKPKSTEIDGKSVQAKLTAATLTGMSRASPFASQRIDLDKSTASGNSRFLTSQDMEELFENYTNALFKMAHSQDLSFTVSVQAMQIVYHSLFHQSIDPIHKKYGGVALDNTSVFVPKRTARFYRSLYAMLLDPRISTSRKTHALFLNLVFKAMKNDKEPVRLIAFIRRLIQVCLAFNAGSAFVAASLVVLGEIIKTISSDEENGKTLEMELNRVIKEGIERLSRKFNFDDNEEEHFEDAPEENDNNVTEILEDVNDSENLQKPVVSLKYDAIHRTPEYSRANQTSVWEIVALANHYHPTVSLFARTLLDGQPINYPSDPLQDFTVSRFLDRFVYKNPKATTGKGDSDGKKVKGKGHHGTSMMQPKPFKSTLLRTSMPMDREFDAPIAVVAKINGLNEKKVPVDESFYTQYFAQKKASKAEDMAASNNIASDVESEDVNEDEIHNAIMNSIPGMENDEGEDDDIDMSEPDSYAESDAESLIEGGDFGPDEENNISSEDGEDFNSDEGDDLITNALDDGDSEADDDEDDDDLIDSADMDDLSSNENSDDDLGGSKSQRRRQQKAAIRQKLSKKPVSDGQKININAAVRAVSKKDVFASAEDYKELLDRDPAFHDSYWSVERIAEKMEDNVGSTVGNIRKRLPQQHSSKMRKRARKQ